MDCHRLLCPWVLQARTLECVAMPTSSGSFESRDRTCLSYAYLHWPVGSLPLAPPGKPLWAINFTLKYVSSSVRLNHCICVPGVMYKNLQCVHNNEWLAMLPKLATAKTTNQRTTINSVCWYKWIAVQSHMGLTFSSEENKLQLNASSGRISKNVTKSEIKRMCTK